MYDLNSLLINETGIVKEIIDCPIKRRLLDLGLTEGTTVKKVFSNLNRSINAYLIRDTLIAIRNEDARSVLLEVNTLES